MEALPQGQYVRHYRYGFGLVTASNSEVTSIDFESHGSKNFVTGLMEVEVSDFTPPKHLRAKWVKTAPSPRPTRKIRLERGASTTGAQAWRVRAAIK